MAAQKYLLTPSMIDGEISILFRMHYTLYQRWTESHRPAGPLQRH